MSNGKVQTTPEIVEWTDVRRNKYLQAIDPAMLTSAGKTYLKKCNLWTDTRVDEPQWRYIHYGRDYVICKLHNTLKPLRCLDADLVQDLISEALERE